MLPGGNSYSMARTGEKPARPTTRRHADRKARGRCCTDPSCACRCDRQPAVVHAVARDDHQAVARPPEPSPGNRRGRSSASPGILAVGRSRSGRAASQLPERRVSMPDERQPPPRPLGPRRPRRFVVRDADDHRVTEKIEKFLSGPRSRRRTQSAPVIDPARTTDTSLDTRTDSPPRSGGRWYGQNATAARRPSSRSNSTSPRRPRQTGRTSGEHRTATSSARSTGSPARSASRSGARPATRIECPRRSESLPCPAAETSEANALRYIDRARQACEVWFTGAALPVRLRIEAASAGRDRSLAALAAVEDRLSA